MRECEFPGKNEQEHMHMTVVFTVSFDVMQSSYTCTDTCAVYV